MRHFKVNSRARTAAAVAVPASLETAKADCVPSKLPKGRREREKERETETQARGRISHFWVSDSNCTPHHEHLTLQPQDKQADTSEPLLQVCRSGPERKAALASERGK